MSLVYDDVYDRVIDTDYHLEDLEESLAERENDFMRYAYFESVAEALTFIGEQGLRSPHVMRKPNGLLPTKPWVVYWYE